MAENITITAAADIQALIDAATTVTIDYDKCRNIINNAVMTAAKSGLDAATILFKQFASNYQTHFWPELQPTNSTTSYNPFVSDGTTIYTYPNRSKDEIGYADHLGACEPTCPFAENILVPLAAAGYSWLFIFAQGEDLPCGFVVSCNVDHDFTDILEDPTYAYNEVVDPYQVAYDSFSIAAVDDYGATTQESYFRRHVASLFNTFNSIATENAAKGKTNISVDFSEFISVGTANNFNMKTFLYHPETGLAAGAEPIYTIDPSSSAEDNTTSYCYTKEYCTDFAIYADKAREILTTESWQQTLAATGITAPTLRDFVEAVSAYSFQPLWSSATDIGSILLSWTPSAAQEIASFAATYNAQILSSAETASDGTSYIVDIPTLDTYTDAKETTNGTYLTSLLTQISSGLTTAMKNSEQTVTVLWSAIDSLNSGVVRTFWETKQNWKAAIKLRDGNMLTCPTDGETLQSALERALSAITVNIATDSLDSIAQTNLYFITPIYYKEQASATGSTTPKTNAQSCGIVVGYRSEIALAAAKSIFNTYIKEKTSNKS